MILCDTVFLDGSKESFHHHFDTLDVFGKYSGCKINLSTSEAVWIGSKRGCLDFPLSIKAFPEKNTV